MRSHPTGLNSPRERSRRRLVKYLRFLDQIVRLASCDDLSGFAPHTKAAEAYEGEIEAIEAGDMACPERSYSMKLIRFALAGRAQHGSLEGDQIQPLEGE